MAKLTRERKLRERRLDKQAKKDARKLAAEAPPAEPADAAGDDLDESADQDLGESVDQDPDQPDLERSVH